MKQKLKTYLLSMKDDDETGVDTISLVNDPAIQKCFVRFGANKKEKFSFIEKEVELTPLSKDAVQQLRMKAMQHNFGSELLSDGSKITWEGDKFDSSVIGQGIFLMDGASDWSLLPDGFFLTLNQQPFEIADGKLKSIGAAQISNAPESKNQAFKSLINK